MGKYRILGTLFDRIYRNNLNANFEDIDKDIQTQRQRVDDLIKGTPQPSEVVDARGGEPVLGDRLNKVDALLAHIVTINVKNPPSPLVGCKGDGIADDTNALKAIATFVNASNQKYSLFFPQGTYNLSDTITFTKPVTLKTDPYIATINWIGTTATIMFKLGADDVNADGNRDLNYRKNKDYNVIGFRFTGGSANLQYAIYVNELVTQPRILNNWFENFNAKWCVYAAKEVWDLVIQGNKHDIEFQSAGSGAYQTGFFNMYPFGNTRVRILDNLITCHQFNGTMIYMNGASCQILRNKIETPYRAIVVGNECRDIYIAYNYFEAGVLVAGDKKGLISIGSFAGDEITSNTPRGVFIFNNYVDLHRTPAKNTSYFVAPTKDTDLLRNVKLVNNYINAWCDDLTPTTPVYQNEIGGQVGNEANGNTFLGTFSDISNWQSGNEAWSGTNSNKNFNRPFNPNKAQFQDILYTGSTYEESGWRFIKDGAAKFQTLVESSDHIKFSARDGQYQRVYPSGKIEFGKTGTNQEYDFFGYVKANYHTIKEQRTSGQVVNGSIFEDTDGKLKYKNLAGTVTDLTL